MLQVVLCSGRPLRLGEFRLVLAFGSQDHDFLSQDDVKNSQDFELDKVEMQIRARCGGLVEIKEVPGEGPTV